MIMDSNNLSRIYDIAIIGGGLSGLSAASYLSTINKNDNTKYNIILLEARDRLGGRTETISSNIVDNSFIDIGGQWIGPGQTMMLNYIKEFQLELIEQEFSNDISTDNDNHSRLIECVNFSFQSLTTEEINEINEFQNFINKIAENFNINKPWDTLNAIEYDNYSVYEYVLEHIKTEGARIEILMFTQTVLACNPKECSFLFLLFYIISGGGMNVLGDGPEGAQKWKVKNGIQQLSHRLLSHCQTKNPNLHVLLSYQVQSITRVESSNSSKDQYYYEILDHRNNNLRSIHCKKIIIAMSPNTIHLQNIIFTPLLSSEKILLSTSLIKGQSIKIIISYHKAFWNGNFHILSNYHKDTDIRDLGYIHNIFKSHVGNNPALVGLITGEYVGKYKLLSIIDRKNVIFKQLSFMYNCKFELAKDCIEFIEKDWSDEIYSSGCYASIMPPNLLTTLKEHIYMSSYNDDIHWASTEIAIHYCGYMEGALQSGETAAINCVNTFHKHEHYI